MTIKDLKIEYSNHLATFYGLKGQQNQLNWHCQCYRIDDSDTVPDFLNNLNCIIKI